jgi:hypothetical protein
LRSYSKAGSNCAISIEHQFDSANSAEQKNKLISAFPFPRYGSIFAYFLFVRGNRKASGVADLSSPDDPVLMFAGATENFDHWLISTIHQLIRPLLP